MEKKTVQMAIIILAILATGAGIFAFSKKHAKVAEAPAEKQKPVEGNSQNQQGQGEQQKFVFDVDPDVNHWQTKETEFFTIKFPKEWYWLESDAEKTGYRSRVITNNPDFDMVKYAGIDIFSAIGQGSPITLSNATEVVITDSEMATSDAGTPQDSIDAIFKLAKKNNPSVDCVVFNNNTIPLIAYCSAIYDSQLQQSYYTVNNVISLTITARTTKDTLVKKEILDKIAESIILKQRI